MTSAALALIAGLLVLLPAEATTPVATSTIPPLQATALDGHTVAFPRDLNRPATLLILGFSRNSETASTAWGKPLHEAPSTPKDLAIYNLPMLAEVPSLVRPLVIRTIRKQIPDALRPTFVPLTTDESTWKHLTHYDPKAPDAAYLLLVDPTGQIRYQTHDPYTPDRLTQLTTEVRKLAPHSR